MMEFLVFFLLCLAIWIWGRLSYSDGYAAGWKSSSQDIPHYEREAERKGKVMVLFHLEQKGLLKVNEDGTIVGFEGNTLKFKVNDDAVIK